MPQTHSRLTPQGRAIWYTERLWALARELPVQAVAIESIPEFDQDCWFGSTPATCRTVARHAQQIQAADLAYPIILAPDGTLMDGGHRLAKAWLLGLTTVQAVQFTAMPAPDKLVPPIQAATDEAALERPALARRLYQLAHLQGEFRLRSGAISHEYFDKYRFEADPATLRQIGLAMQELLPVDVDALAGLEMGGIPVATMLSQLTGIPARFVRKTAKPYGTCQLAEGGDVAGRTLVIIEDVVTSGGQVIESALALRGLGAVVENVLCVIDRQAGGRENLAKAGLRLRALFTQAQLEMGDGSGE
ncbi:MAG: phosphoribosyltransferase family protein [Caldilineaceae bacterium]